MPIKMKKNYNPGDNDSEAVDGYPFCQITVFHQNALTFAVMIEYAFGYCTGHYLEHFEKGKGSPTKVLECPPEKVAQLWSQPAKEGESVGAAMRRLTYTYLIESGTIDGEIMNNPPLPPEEAKPEAPKQEEPAASEPEAPAEDAAPVSDEPAAEPEAPVADEGGEAAPSAEEAEAEAPVEPEPVPSPS